MKYPIHSKNETRFIIIIFIILAILTVISQLFGLYQLRIMNGITNTMHDRPFKVSTSALIVTSEVFEMHRDMKDIVLSQSKEELQKYIHEVDTNEKYVFTHLALIRQYIKHEKGKQLLNHTEKLIRDWKPIRDEVIRLVKNNERDKAIALTKGKGAHHVLMIEKSATNLYHHAKIKAAEFKNHSDAMYKKLSISIILIGSMLLMLYVFLTYFTVRRISNYTAKNYHLTSVLSVIRAINQLIVRVKERKVLIEESCKILVSNHVYGNALIVLFDDNKGVEYITSSDNSDNFAAFKTKLENGWIPHCIKRVAEGDESHLLIKNTKLSCSDCPLTDMYQTKGAFSIQLKYNDKVYGNISLSVDNAYIYDKEEISLLEEVAGDLSYALYNFETEEHLREQEKSLNYFKELYENIIDSVDNIIFVKDINFTYIVCNQAFEKFVGKANHEIIGKTDYEIFGKEVADFFRSYDVKMFEGDKSQSNFEWVTYPDGSQVYLYTVKSPLVNSDGKLLGLVGNSADLTEQKRVEEALLESEEQFKLMMQQSPSIIELYDLNGLQIEVNHAYEELWGFEASHTLNSFNLFKSEEVKRTGLIDYILRAYAGESVAVPPYEFNSTGPSEGKGRGRKRWLTTRIYPLKDTAGNVKNIVITHEDITEKRESYQQLEQKKKELETILQEAPNPIMLHNENGEVVMVNRVWKSLSGYSDEEINTVEKWAEQACAKNKPLMHEYMDKLYSLEHKVDMGEATVTTKEGNTLVWQFSSAPLGIIDGKRTVVTTAMDITELKRKDQLMMAQSRHAAMGEMIGMIAHQWRQPISGIAMNANNILLDIALESFDNASAAVYAEDILDQTQHLSKTIDDFRNFFKPDKSVSTVILKDIIEETFLIVKDSLTNNGIDIKTTYLTDTKVDAYSRELMQVFVNIINNAKDVLVSKHTKAPFIDICVDEDEFYVNTTVCDNGGGIDKAILPKLFDPYFTTKDEKTGTGLGLYMSKMIIEDHLHGIIEAYNNNEGACFKVKLLKQLPEVESVS